MEGYGRYGVLLAGGVRGSLLASGGRVGTFMEARDNGGGKGVGFVMGSRLLRYGRVWEVLR